MPPQRPRHMRRDMAAGNIAAFQNALARAGGHRLRNPVGHPTAAGRIPNFPPPVQRPNSQSIMVPVVCHVPIPVAAFGQAGPPQALLNGMLPGDLSMLQAAAAAAARPPPGIADFPPPRAGVGPRMNHPPRPQRPPQNFVPDHASSNRAVLPHHSLHSRRGPRDDEELFDDGDDEMLLPEFRKKSSEIWEAMFKRLVNYKAKCGDCLVPCHYKDDPKLGRWVMNQRHKKQQLTPGRKQRLNAIGFVWSVKQQETWDSMFERLLKYKTMHGNCLVPQKYKPDMRLGEWVQTQRRDKKRRRNLSPDRRAKLEAIGFEWCPHQYVWTNMFDRLRSYKARYGNCLVPRHFQEDPKLGRWVDQQRVKNKKGNLPAERKGQLDSIGFVWKMR